MKCQNSITNEMFVIKDYSRISNAADINRKYEPQQKQYYSDNILFWIDCIRYQKKTIAIVNNKMFLLLFE